MGYDPGGVEQVRCHLLFDPFGVVINFPVCTVGYHGYSHSAPSGLGFPNAIPVGPGVRAISCADCSYGLDGDQSELFLDPSENRTFVESGPNFD